MSRPRMFVALLLVVSSLALTACIGAMKTSPDDPVGTGGLKPTQEDKDGGLIGIAPGFDLKSYGIISVGLFPVTEPDINDDEDKQLAREMPPYFQSELVRRLRDTGLFAQVINLSETEFKPGTDKALKLDGAITRLAPGSRALRYIVGMGAGRTKAQAEMYFTDAQTGKPVMVTADRAAAAYGVFGGDSRDHLRESFDDMARDLARFLVRLSKGAAPRKD